MMPPPHIEGRPFVSGTRYIATMLTIGLVVFAWRHADPLRVATSRIRAPHLDAVVTPRWLVRTRSSGRDAFHRAGARVLQAVEALAYGPAALRGRG